MMRYMIWYDWQAMWWFDIMHNLDMHMKSYDRIIWYKGKCQRVVIHYNERKNVGTSCIIVFSCIEGYPYIFYNGTNAYNTRQGDDHYICYNATKVAIPNRCLTSTALRCSRDKKRAEEVCELTGGFIFVRVVRV